MSVIEEGDTVEFQGPLRDVQRWPSDAERGIVAGLENGAVKVLWNTSTLLLTWPVGWLRKVDTTL